MDCLVVSGHEQKKHTDDPTNGIPLGVGCPARAGAIHPCLVELVFFIGLTAAGGSGVVEKNASPRLHMLQGGSVPVSVPFILPLLYIFVGAPANCG